MPVAMGEGSQLLQPAGNCRGKAVLPRDVCADNEVLGGLQLVGPVGTPQLLHLQVDCRVLRTWADVVNAILQS